MLLIDVGFTENVKLTLIDNPCRPLIQTKLYLRVSLSDCQDLHILC